MCVVGLFVVPGAVAQVGPTYSWSTVWGRLSWGSEDGTIGTARFRDVHGLAFDAAGNLFVADTGNHTIRKITPDGAVSTLAGQAGASGSADGTGAAARFNAPTGLAVDPAGNIIVADTGNHTLRRVTPAGAVTTIAGQPNVAGNVDGLVASATLDSPQEIAVDSAGVIYLHAGKSGIRRLKDGRVDTFISPEQVNKTAGALVSTAKTGAIAIGPGDALFFQGWDFQNSAATTVLMRRDTSGNLSTLSPTRSPSYPYPLPAPLHLTRGPDGVYALVQETHEAVATYWVYRLPNPDRAEFAGRAWMASPGLAVNAAGGIFLSGYDSTGAGSLDAIARIPDGAANADASWTDTVAVPWAGEIERWSGREGDGTTARFNLLVRLEVDRSGALWGVDLKGYKFEGRGYFDQPALVKMPAGGVARWVASGSGVIRTRAVTWNLGLDPRDGTAYFGAANSSGQSWSLQKVSPDGTVAQIDGRPYPELTASTSMVVDGAGNQVIADRGLLRKRTLRGSGRCWLA